MSDYFAQKSLDSPRLLAEMLVSSVLDCDRLRLYTDADRPASGDELAQLRSLVARAGRHEPVQYLTGEAWFFGLRFEITPATLIPRPSTETIIEHVLQRQRERERDRECGREHEQSRESIRIADIGTGSGCIAVALAVHLPGARIVATDVSDEAIAVAARNADAHGVADRIEWRRGSLYEPIDQGARDADDAGTGGASTRFDYVISNPPYISDREWAEVEANVKDYEPHSSLRAGREGMDVLEPLIGNVARYLREPDGLALFEIAASQSAIVRACAENNPCLRVDDVLRDLDGHPRVLVLDVNGD